MSVIKSEGEFLISTSPNIGTPFEIPLKPEYTPAAAATADCKEVYDNYTSICTSNYKIYCCTSSHYWRQLLVCDLHEGTGFGAARKAVSGEYEL